MAKAHTNWKVLPHGPLTLLDDGLWRVEGSLEGGVPLKRVMTVARRTDGSLVVHNAIALEQDEMMALDALGPVRFIVVPNGFHRLDAPLFKQRYPEAKVVAPVGSKKKVEQVVPVDLVYEDFPSDEAVELRTLSGFGGAEGVMIVKSTGGASLVFNDAVFNMPHVPGLQGFVLKHVTKSTGGPCVSNVVRLFLLKDKAAFRADLEALAKTPNLRRIVMSHHEVIDQDAAEALTKIAATL